MYTVQFCAEIADFYRKYDFDTPITIETISKLLHEYQKRIEFP